MNIKTITSTAAMLLLSASVSASTGFNLDESGFSWSTAGLDDNFVAGQNSLSEIFLSEEELNDNGYNWSSEAISANYIENSFSSEGYLSEIGYSWQ